MIQVKMCAHIDEGIARLDIRWMLVNQSSMAKLATLTNDKMLFI